MTYDVKSGPQGPCANSPRDLASLYKPGLSGLNQQSGPSPQTTNMPSANKLGCPICFQPVGSTLQLIRHCLNEARAKVVYKCLDCQKQRDLAHWTWFDTNSHYCYRNGKSYSVVIEHNQLDHLKLSLKMAHNIKEGEVDQVVKDMNWAPPFNLWLMNRAT